MKILGSIILISFILHYSCVTTYPFTTGFPDPIFERVVETTHSKDNAFVIANSWLVEKMKSAEDVIQFSDKESGIIKGKFYFRYEVTKATSGGFSSTGIVKVEGLITLNFKDNKARIEIRVAGEKSSSMLGEYDKWTEAELSEYKAKVNYLLEDFERVMIESTSNDW